MKLTTILYYGSMILLPVIAVVVLATMLSYGAVWKPAPKPKMFFGQQFNESDLKGTTGKIYKLAVACDLTTTIVPDLMTDGFIPTETSTIKDVNEKVYVITFWKRLDMRVVTETDKNNMTCIISVSNNVKPLQSFPPFNKSSGESRDNLYEYIPI
jgi:hypothetical protein